MFGGISRGTGRVGDKSEGPSDQKSTMLRSERITRPQIIVPCVTTAARGHACSLRAPLTCIGRIRHLGASVPWGAPSAGASSARCARLRPASWPPPPEGSKGGRRLSRRRACARAKHRSRRSLWAPSGDRSHMRPPVGAAGRPGAARCRAARCAPLAEEVRGTSSGTARATASGVHF